MTAFLIIFVGGGTLLGLAIYIAVEPAETPEAEPEQQDNAVKPICVDGACRTQRVNLA